MITVTQAQQLIVSICAFILNYFVFNFNMIIILHPSSSPIIKFNDTTTEYWINYIHQSCVSLSFSSNYVCALNIMTADS